MLVTALALALATSVPAHVQARGVDRFPDRAPVLVQYGADDTEVVWHEDQMCFCEWQHAPVPPADHFRAVQGVPVRVPDDFARHTVEGVEAATF
jgi:hypothetical protein